MSVPTLENQLRSDIVPPAPSSPTSQKRDFFSNRGYMKRLFLLAGALLLSACAASATTTQKWTAGWDNFSEPLNFTKSKIMWSVNSTTRKITVTFNLAGATPSKLYQVS